ncbi:MAG: NAD-dependent succinate-semialdehyde dehydrogenase [Bacteroidota bacterium]|nr:NAD-dependent succinate-semialdehyde dehydrogenase [Bacteroidota bacterium]
MNTELVSQLIGKKYELLIGGKSVPSSSNKWDDVVSPANGERVAQVASATPDDVNAAVASAKEAFKKWSSLTGWDREKIIKKATAYVRTQAEKIGYLMALEQGKPFEQSKGEVTSSCDLIDYYAAEAVRVEGYINVTEKPSLRSWVIYQPVGVCGLITPWNYPISLLSWKLGPALAAGCTVVVKPTEVTPLSPLSFCQAMIEGGIPEGVINVLMGKGDVGAALVAHKDVAKVAMTGSTSTGKKIMQTIAPYLKKVSLELGGHCPAIVAADADIDNAAEIVAYKGFRNMGQSCSTVNRVYVHKSIYNEFVNKLKAKGEKMKIGDGVEDGKCDIGPMATKEVLSKVKDHVKDAVDKGATLVLGGHAPEGDNFSRGNYYTPTILTGVDKKMKVMNEETFGPVVPVDTFDTLEEAIEKANDTSYGLCAYLFAKDFKTIMKVSESIEAGTVCVNNGSVNTAYAPYEGWKESGFGIELGRRAIHEYLKTKHIKVDTL